MKVAVMGYGTVGSGVAEVIETHEKSNFPCICDLRVFI